MTHPQSYDVHLLFGPTPQRGDPDAETEWFSLFPPIPAWVADGSYAVTRGTNPPADGIRNLSAPTGKTPVSAKAKEAIK